MTHVITEITSPVARLVMHPHGTRDPRVEHLARAAYEGHGIGLCGPSWDDLGNAQKERWRWTVRAVLHAAQNTH